LIASKNFVLDRRLFVLVSLLVGGLFDAQASHALGTDAGVNIQNTASVNFEINGTAQTPVNSNTVQTLVDELIDVVVVDNNGGPVAVSTPDTGIILQFTVTNNGNGAEVFRVIANPNVVEGGFDPLLDQLYLESNGIPGLQIGADTAYVSGTSDPLLAEDESLVVYVVSNIPVSLSQGDNGDVELRAVSETIITQAGVDNPDDAGWPTPGTSYAGLGNGGGDIVVGTSHDTSNLLMRTTGRYQVSDAVINVTKSSITVLDPFGGTTLVPGTVITYQIDVAVTGTGSADGVVISDLLPAELEYQLNSLSINGVAEDDDFAPLGVDGSGYNTGASTVVVDRGVVAGGSPTIVITFDAAIR